MQYMTLIICDKLAERSDRFIRSSPPTPRRLARPLLEQAATCNLQSASTLHPCLTTSNRSPSFSVRVSSGGYQVPSMPSPLRLINPLWKRATLQARAIRRPCKRVTPKHRLRVCPQISSAHTQMPISWHFVSIIVCCTLSNSPFP